MTIIVSVFMSGCSQALRLPTRLHLQAKAVNVAQIGNELWLHPETPQEQDMVRWLQQFYASTGPLPEKYLADRRDAAPQQRDCL